MPSTKNKSVLDFTDFPPGSVTEYSTLLCLACTFDIFTKQLGMAPRTAYSEIKKYSPTVAELTSPKAVRPFFDSDEQHPHCPYCNAAKRWHTVIDTYRIEGGKASDVARRKLVQKLPKKDEQFRVIESKSDKRTAFFDWLDTLDRHVDLDDDTWFVETTRAYLGRLEPKTNWGEVFEDVRSIRRSHRLNEGWEKERSHLYLAPNLFNEILAVQYLVSRSHVRGGRTLAGRLTLQELIRRLRSGGYLDANNISAGDQFQTLEGLIEKLAGGSGNVKLYHVVDRRDFLKKLKSVYAKYS
jgi:hypothetical protein